ncbi:spore gernimation protein [Paenibacillus selenitireducens]|uniref:Spore gernimation protein n=1 Tax=Paenibacillus selenitireducens TaxID=1324314 RepID=A0A1T2X6J0_9BACL|nr:endospore germination permease [Paenibacillus selenitireducens]OPA75296.1 spore gernimation protein [Paenibacillus selenitireducens]
MVAMNSKISFFQASLILMLMNGLLNHVIVNPMILDAAGRDSWLSVIFTSVPFLAWCMLIVFIMKKSGQQKLQPWLAEKTSPFFSWILIIPMAIQIYFIGGMTVFHTATWTITNYLPASPKLVLTITISFICFYAARLGIRTIAICSGILLPFVIFLGYFVSISNMPIKDFGLLRPILEHGVRPAISGMVYAGSGLIELIILLTMQHHLKFKIKTWHLLIFALMMVYIMLGPVIGAITEFGPKEAAKQLESPYEQWRLVKIGDYFEHVDFFSVFQWLSGASIRISLSLFLLADMFPFQTPESRTRFMLGITISYILVSMLPISQEAFYAWMYGYYLPISLSILFLLSMAWLGISIFTKTPKEGTT